jgi:hypothetical protein
MGMVIILNKARSMYYADPVRSEDVATFYLKGFPSFFSKGSFPLSLKCSGITILRFK